MLRSRRPPLSLVPRARISKTRPRPGVRAQQASDGLSPLTGHRLQVAQQDPDSSSMPQSKEARVNDTNTNAIVFCYSFEQVDWKRP